MALIICGFFYLRIQVYAIEKWPFSGTYPLISSDRWSLYANSLYASKFLESPSLAYNKVHLYLSCQKNKGGAYHFSFFIDLRQLKKK